MWKWIKKVIKWFYLKLNRCPYCHEKFESGFIWDGSNHAPSLLCPYRHYIIKNNVVFVEDKAKVKYLVIDMGGASIPVPEENIRYDYKFDDDTTTQ